MKDIEGSVLDLSHTSPGDEENEPASPGKLTPERKPASEHTVKANRAVLKELDFSDEADFADARKGFIASLDPLVIESDDGKPVYDGESFKFIDGDAPDTVNPSFWRQSRLNAMAGLYEVVEGIYQIRSFDLAHMTLMEGETGWIVIDPLTSVETSRAGLKLANEKLGDRPVKAVIHTHSHIDHWGGVGGVVTAEEVKSGQVQLIGPQGFFAESISENVLAGNQMGRRASYMYGTLLGRDPKGTIGSGLGTTISVGDTTICEPSLEITETGQKLKIDGIDFEFQLTPGAEAPVEIMFFLPGFKAFCRSEEINHNQHNLYTLRGAKVRSGLLWSKWIKEAIEIWGDRIEVLFGSHHWPVWGNENALEVMKKQRDLYRYIHDETLRLANHGHTMIEIAEMIELPKSLSSVWANRGYYGTLNHNAKAQYQLYFGWFGGNPAQLHELPPVEISKKYVEYMGGSEEAMAKAKSDFDDGNYRFVATVLNHIVFADPENEQARYLLADTYEQLGYQAESGPWRNFYLSGAQELRQGVTKNDDADTGKRSAASVDFIEGLTLEAIFDNMAVALNGPKAAGKEFTFNFVFPDTRQEVVLRVENGVLNHTFGRQDENADATVTLDRDVLNDIIAQITSFQKAILDGKVKVQGRRRKLLEFHSLVDSYDFWFNIVTP